MRRAAREARRQAREARRQVEEARRNYERVEARGAVVDRLVESIQAHTEANGFAIVIRQALGAHHR